MKRFKKNNNLKINILIVVVILLIVGYTSKSYAIYKLEEKYDVIKRKIESYGTSDFQIAAIIDGKESTYFPSFETNYKVLSVECTNGATGSFDVENWRVAIDDMSSSSTKCIVSFDSSKTNQVQPINMTKNEILALNEEIKTTTAREIADYLYPVGSIFTSTELSTVEEVENRYGGTWVRYSTGTSLIGYDESNTLFNEINKTGGATTQTLGQSNLPSHSHVIPQLSVSTWSASHTHPFVVNIQHSDGGTTTGEALTSGLQRNGRTRYYGTTQGTTITVSGQKTTASNTTTCTNCSAAAFSTLDPYTVVYMYKRTA